MALQDIDHIVFVMLENRSFDHMLGYLSLDETPNPIGVDGLKSDRAWRRSWANSGDGIAYEVNRIGPGRKQKIKDPPHGSNAVKQQIETPTAGGASLRMGGFVQAYIDSRTKHVDKHGRPKPQPKPKRPGDVMAYYDAEALPAFDFFARNFCVCDRWFTPLPVGTQANRLMAMSGASKIVNNVKSINDFPEQELVYDWLTARDIPWRVYTWGGFVPFFALMKSWRGPIAGSMLTGEGNFRRFSRLEKHWRDMDREFPAVTFIEPEYSDGPGFRPNDDHPPTGAGGGQALLGEVYNILVSNPARWQRTLMIVTYDEHGGFFDHVEPLGIGATIGATHLPTTGPRVPALLVSPHVQARDVYKHDLDHTSFLQLLADRFAGGHYSPEVTARQAQLSGSIAGALRAPRTGAAAAPPHTPLEIKAFANSTHEWLANGISLRTPRTPNAAALDGAVRKMYEEYPRLSGHPDTGEMTLYVQTKKAPDPEKIDHIDDG
jgi:phospholipase C